MALLKHLEAVGFEGAPRPVGDGFDADGLEAITYIPGTTPHPTAWDDQAVSAIGALLRRLAAWLNAQLHDDDIAERVGLPSAARRGRQVRLLLDAYGLPAAERVSFVDRMIEWMLRNRQALERALT